MIDFIRDFFDNPLSVFVCVWVLIRLVLGVFELISTKNTSSLKKTLSELEKIIKEGDTMGKYRLPDYEQNVDSNVNRQSFTPYTDKYVYNEDTGELKLAVDPKTGEILKENDQAKIDSYVFTSLDKILEKFLPSDYAQTVAPVEDSQFGDSSQIYKDLDDYAAIIDHAEELREKYGLDADMSTVDVFDFIDKLNTRYKDKIDGYVSAKSQQVSAKSEQASEPVQTQNQIDYDLLAQSILKNQNKEVQ